MTEHDKQRLDELEATTAYLQARQQEQEARMNQIMARLVYIEARQYRIMQELGMKPDQLDTQQAAYEDAKAINLTYIPEIRFN